VAACRELGGPAALAVVCVLSAEDGKCGDRTFLVVVGTRRQTICRKCQIGKAVSLIVHSTGEHITREVSGAQSLAQWLMAAPPCGARHYP
jgi:hypothetical protein